MVRKRRLSKQRNVRNLVAKVNPRSPISEQYRVIRTNIQFASVEHPTKSLLITSPGQGEGKTTTAANLAIVYAQQGKKVLLIDADMRKPTIHYVFRLNNMKGLSSILIGEHSLREAVQGTDIPNLEIIPSGPIPPNPAELLGTKRMEQLLKEAEESYDVVLFDTSPVLAVTDSQILASSVDSSILVIKSGETEIEAAQKAQEALEPAQAKLLGVVLNGRREKRSSYYYYGNEA